MPTYPNWGGASVSHSTYHTKAPDRERCLRLQAFQKGINIVSKVIGLVLKIQYRLVRNGRQSLYFQYKTSPLNTLRQTTAVQRCLNYSMSHTAPLCMKLNGIE